MDDSQKKKLRSAREAAAKSAALYGRKAEIKNKAGEVTDHACAAGRVNRFVAMVCERKNVSAAQATKYAGIQAQLEQDAVKLLRDAEGKTRAYVELCLSMGVTPKPINVNGCDCGYCNCSTAGRVSLLWVAERDFQIEIRKMIVNDGGRPDFSTERQAIVDEAFDVYAAYAKALGLQTNMEDVFYGGWNYGTAGEKSSPS